MAKTDKPKYKPVTPASLFNAAKAFHAAANVLFAHQDEAQNLGIPRDYLLAHAVELGLKAYLRHAGWSEDDIADRKQFGHDLARGWNAARRAGLGISEDLPRWCLLLSGGHRSPYLSRYPRASTGSVRRPFEETSDAVGHLLLKIEGAIGGSPANTAPGAALTLPRMRISGYGRVIPRQDDDIEEG